jgi:hypothetical protein
MFNKDFFPTPDVVASRMWQELRYSNYILEPSAGKGDLLDCYKKTFSGNWTPRFDAIEANPELSMILKGKGYNVIHDDFLTFRPSKSYDGIIMNPPFSNGAAHLLNAWDILKSGKIVALLNSETLSNPYTCERKLLKRIIDDNGCVEGLGQCFVDSERKTGVDVSMVILEKTSSGSGFSFEDISSCREGLDFSIDRCSEHQLSQPDVIDTLTNMYDNALVAHREFLIAKNKVNFYVKHLTADIGSNDLFCSGDNDQENYNKFSDKLNEACWDSIFEKTDIRRFVTSGIRKDFNSFRDDNRFVDFTRKNIKSLVSTLGMSASSIQESALLCVFDMLTRYDKKNTVHIEGWKTNDAYKVNRKVIIPNIVEDSKWSDKPSFCFWSNSNREYLKDIDIVMSGLAGKSFNNVLNIDTALSDAFKNGWGAPCRSEFFDIKFYKKGTIHLKFLSKTLLDDFNRAAARGKNWLPGDREASK